MTTTPYRRTPDDPPELRRRLGEVLVSSGMLSEESLELALAAQSGAPAGRRRLGQVVVDLGLVGESDVAAALADLLALDVVDARLLDPDIEVALLLPQGFASSQRVVAVRWEGERLVVVAADPTNVVALDDVRLLAGVRELEVQVAPESHVRELVARVYGSTSGARAFTAMQEHLDALPTAQDALPDSHDPADAPTVRLVDAILEGALDQRASDVHCEPHATGMRVRYRVDGALRDVMELPAAVWPSLISRIKIMAGLDIAERRLPQDGRSEVRVGDRRADLRVSTLPSIHGEKVVLRLLSIDAELTSLEVLGLGSREVAVLRRALEASHGLVVITGPTGAGKSSTLYASLREVIAPARNVVTLEDPVEIRLPGITQVQVNERAGMTFARGLRSVLRQDPDVVLVGEVRDRDTAELALRASLTGHLVLTTLHTNDAVSALSRLVDMGAEPFLVASSLSVVVAQRLVRRPCTSCARPVDADPALVVTLSLSDTWLAGAQLMSGTGCLACGNTGYRGRMGVFEVLEVTPSVRTTLLSNPTQGALGEAAAAQGMTTLRAAALAAAREGRTTLEEVLRVTELAETDATSCRSCGRGVRPHMVTCPWCATDLAVSRCGRCGQPQEPEWVVCPWCPPAG